MYRSLRRIPQLTRNGHGIFMETKQNHRVGPRSMSLCKTGLKGPMMFEVML